MIIHLMFWSFEKRPIYMQDVSYVVVYAGFFLIFMDREHGIFKIRRKTYFFVLNGQFFYGSFKIFEQAAVPS